VWVTGKSVIPLTRAIPERIRGGYDDVPYKSMLTYFTLLTLLKGVPVDNNTDIGVGLPVDTDKGVPVG